MQSVEVAWREAEGGEEGPPAVRRVRLLANSAGEHHAARERRAARPRLQEDVVTDSARPLTQHLPFLTQHYQRCRVTPTFPNRVIHIPI